MLCALQHGSVFRGKSFKADILTYKCLPILDRKSFGAHLLVTIEMTSLRYAAENVDPEFGPWRIYIQGFGSLLENSRLGKASRIFFGEGGGILMSWRVLGSLHTLFGLSTKPMG